MEAGKPTTGPVTPEDLARWREVADAATPGPWADVGYGFISAGDETGKTLHRFEWEDSQQQADADFIATARSALPRLVEEVERLREAEGAAQARADIAEASVLKAVFALAREQDENARLREALEKVCESATTPEGYALRGFGVVFHTAKGALRG